MRRAASRSSLTGWPAALVASTRSTGANANLNHHFLNHVKVVQPDGVDGLVQTKIEQQQWLNTEQWDGYSDTYLARFMVYGSTVDAPNPRLTPKQPILDPLLSKVFNLYGPSGNTLHDLTDDPLHPAFHYHMGNVKANVETIASEIDRVYASLHPTVKTLYDAYLVRRYFHLQDWIHAVEKKRATILSSLSDEYISKILEARNVAERHMESLRRIEALFSSAGGDADEGFLRLEPGQMFSLEEIEVVKQKARFTRNLRRVGVNWEYADRHCV